MSGEAGTVAAPEHVREGSRSLSVRAFLRAHALVVSAATWLLLVLNFAALQFGSTDELVQYGFVRRLFGQSHQDSAYLVGLAFLETPFYALGELLGKLGLHHPGGHPITQLTIALGFGVATLLIWPLLGSVLRGLDLPGAGRSLLLAGLGMPLFFYATFQPSKSHGIECVLFALALFLTFRLFGGDVPRWLPFALGGTLALVTGVRYLDAGIGVALVAVLLVFRRIRPAVEVAVGAIVTGAVLAGIPLAMGASLTLADEPNPGILHKNDVPVGIHLSTPLNMLVSERHGLVLVSPIALVGLAGFVVVWRRRAEHRHFLGAVTAMVVGLLAFQAATPWYYGGVRWGFGQRYLTVLMPVVALGVAGAMLAWPRAATLLCALCAAWTVYLMLNLVTLGEPQNTRGSVAELARAPQRLHISPGAYFWGVRYKSNFLHWTVK